MPKQKIVLIAEDEPTIALELSEELVAAGFSVVTCGRSDEGVRAVQDCRIAAAVVDLWLADGFVTPLVMRLAAGGVPIVLHTAMTDLDDVLKLCPGAPVIRKPSFPNAVVGALRTLLENGVAQSAYPPPLGTASTPDDSQRP